MAGFTFRTNLGRALTFAEYDDNLRKSLNVEEGGGLPDAVPLTFGDDLDAALKWDGANLSLALTSGKFQVGGGLQLWDGAAWQDVPHKGASTIPGQWTFSGKPIFSGAGTAASGSINLTSTVPEIRFEDTDLAGAGKRYWFHHQGGTFYLLQDRNDDGAWDSPHPWYVAADGSMNIGVKLGMLTGAKLAFATEAGEKTQLFGTGYTQGIQTSTHYMRSGHTFAFHVGGVHAAGQADPGTGGTCALRFDATGLFQYLGNAVLHEGRFLEASVTWDIPLIAVKSSQALEVDMPGAAVGDYFISASHTGVSTSASAVFSGVVRQANKVLVWAYNPDGAVSSNVPSGILYVRVQKRV